MPSRSLNQYKVVDDVCCLSCWSEDPRTKGIINDAVFPAYLLRYVKSHGPWVFNHSNFYSINGRNLTSCIASVYGIDGSPIRIDDGPNYFNSNIVTRSSFYGGTLRDVEGIKFKKGLIPPCKVRHLEEIKTFEAVKYTNKVEWQYLDIRVGSNKYVKIKINKFLVRYVPKKMVCIRDRLYACAVDVSSLNHLHSSKRRGPKFESILLKACGIISPLLTDMYHKDLLDFRIDPAVYHFTTNTRLPVNYYDDTPIPGTSLLIIKSHSMPRNMCQWVVPSINSSLGYAFILIDSDKEEYAREYEWVLNTQGWVHGKDEFEGSKVVLLHRLLAEKSGLSIREEWISGVMTATYSRALESTNLALRAKIEAAQLNRKRGIRYRKSTHKKHSVVRADSIIFVPIGVGVYALDLRSKSLRVSSGRATLPKVQ